MKLYKIRDWGNLYENSRSRVVDDLTWVKFTNRHDGENFSMIMAHPEGAKIFSAFVLMVQIASRCNPRGTLIRSTQVPHDGTSMAVKCRAPKEWFEIALPYLETQTDWIEVEEFEPKRQSGDAQVPSICRPSAEERKKERIERKKEGGGLVDQKEWKAAELNGAYKQFKGEVAALYGRTEGQTWNYQEDFAMIQISKRPNLMAEWAALKAYRSKMEDQKFFPRSVSTLLENWDKTLDASRTHKTAKPKVNHNSNP